MSWRSSQNQINLLYVINIGCNDIVLLELIILSTHEQVFSCILAYEHTQ